MTEKDNDWVCVATDTRRLKVPGGYLYQYHNTQPVFVARKEWTLNSNKK